MRTHYHQRAMPPQPAALRDPATRPSLLLQQLALARGGRLLFSGLDLRLEAGSALAVLGPNGAGKSSLLAALAGRLAPQAGRVLRSPGLGLGLAELPQLDRVERDFPITVRDFVATGLWPRFGLWRRIDRPQRERLAAVLQRVGLAELAEAGLDRLSGGQWQRARIARLLLQDAGLWLLDEPANALDAAAATLLDGLLHEARAAGRIVVTVLHPQAALPAVYDRVLRLPGAAGGRPLIEAAVAGAAASASVMWPHAA